jgi:hypothetical protein
MTTPTRLLLNSKDIMNITGFSRSTALKIGTELRKFFKKPLRSRISVAEFCEYMKLPEEKVRPFLI